MHLFDTTTLLAGLLATRHARLALAITYEDVEHTFDTLQTWYNASTGTYEDSTGWWNSAVCMTMLAKYASIDDSIKQRTDYLWDDVFTKAPQHNSEMTTSFGSAWKRQAASISVPRRHKLKKRGTAAANVGFLNGFYDDQGWWALAWIAVYDHTGGQKYLDEAITIFNDMHTAWNTTPVGGIWWDKQHSYVNAIANELHFSVAAHLANRCPQDKEKYTSMAQDAWNWLYASGMINSNNNVEDGLLAGSHPGNTKMVWSYNQGVILSALTELSRATAQPIFTQIAKVVANAALVNLTGPNNGTYDGDFVLRDPCEAGGGCGQDGASFKGVFASNLAGLLHNTNNPTYARFLKANADSLWTKGLDQYNRLNVAWDGSSKETPGASSQCSGMGLLVGALSELGQWESTKSPEARGAGLATSLTPERWRKRFFGLW